MNAAHNQRQDLPAARRRLDYAISGLIDPQPVTVTREDGSTTLSWLDPLFDQLADAVAGQSGERSGGQSTVPIWLAIVKLVDDINTQVRLWSPEWPHPDLKHTPVPTTIARLQALKDRKWRVEDTDHIDSISVTIDGWIATIRSKLDPEPVIYLMAPPPETGAAKCTACGTDYVWKPDPDENNKPKRQPALRVTKDGCHCQNPKCGARWEPGSLRVLAAALGYPLPEGCLE